MLPAALLTPQSLWMPRCGRPPPTQKARRAGTPSAPLIVEEGDLRATSSCKAQGRLPVIFLVDAQRVRWPSTASRSAKGAVDPPVTEAYENRDDSPA